MQATNAAAWRISAKLGLIIGLAWKAMTNVSR